MADGCPIADGWASPRRKRGDGREGNRKGNKSTPKIYHCLLLLLLLLLLFTTIIIIIIIVANNRYTIHRYSR